jgi:hypothetical protein
VLDVTAIFGGIKKKVLSKNFKGGDIVAVMGGTEINLTQADFNGRISIDSFTMFGGTKLVIPPDWEVQSEVVAIFGGIEDKRPPATQHTPGKILFLEALVCLEALKLKASSYYRSIPSIHIIICLPAVTFQWAPVVSLTCTVGRGFSSQV